MKLGSPTSHQHHQLPLMGKEYDMNEIQTKPRIVIVDDEGEAAEALARVLRLEGYTLVSLFFTPESAIEGLTHITCPFILISDWDMPGMKGGELVAHFKAYSVHDFVTCIVSGHDSIEMQITVRKAGAQQVFRKGQSAELFLILLKTLEQELHIRSLAMVDKLTQASRKEAAEAMAKSYLASKPEHECVACILIDADDFKQINDTHGHEAGDQALQAIGLEVQRHIQRRDIFGRDGGDEFSVFLRNVSADDAVSVASRLSEGIAHRPVRVMKDGKVVVEIHVEVSIGISTLDDYSGERYDYTAMYLHLRRAADAAMYSVKKKKKLKG